ncbi:MAG: hypothetical protein WA002_13110 [Candidatus Acidiferrales bacterium]
MRNRDSLILTLAVFLFSAAFGGCGTKEGPAPSQASAPASQPASAAAPAPAAAPSSAPAAAPLAATDGDIPGIRVAITDLKRTSSATTLKFTLYNDTDSEFAVYGKFTEDPYAGWTNFGGVHLIDTNSKKKYFAVMDSDRKCLCSDGVAPIAKKSSIALWVKYPPIPDDVQKITVQIPHFIPMEDVPITR